MPRLMNPDIADDKRCLIVQAYSAPLRQKRLHLVDERGRRCFGCHVRCRFWGLTFELRRDQRQDARPGPVIMYPCHRPGPGGLLLGLASNEGLGRIAASVQGVE